MGYILKNSVEQEIEAADKNPLGVI
jgi:hypothetical protein